MLAVSSCAKPTTVTNRPTRNRLQMRRGVTMKTSSIIYTALVVGDLPQSLIALRREFWIPASVFCVTKHDSMTIQKRRRRLADAVAGRKELTEGAQQNYSAQHNSIAISPRIGRFPPRPSAALSKTSITSIRAASTANYCARYRPVNGCGRTRMFCSWGRPESARAGCLAPWRRRLAAMAFR